jgi:hypothetical protein
LTRDAGQISSIHVEPLKRHPRVFNRPEPYWSDGANNPRYNSRNNSDSNQFLSNLGPSRRQVEVQEALYGTWEREGSDAVRPGLEGVQEWLNARGMGLKESAEAWNKRDEELSGDKEQAHKAEEPAVKSTEDGM